MAAEDDDPAGEETAISPATTVSKSLRSTIPSAIVKQFRLTKEDKLRWKMEVNSGHLIIVVEPVKKPKSEAKATKK